MPELPDDLADAPLPVRQAAAFVDKNRARQKAFTAIIATSFFGGLFSTALLHDIAGWSELASGIPLLLGILVVVGATIWAVKGPLKGVPEKQAMIQRYRALKEMGLATPSASAEDASAVERLCDRVIALSGDRAEVAEAARSARDRVVALQQERSHVAGMMDEDADLAGELAGVAERIEAEIARIRAHLAETYAALIEVDAPAGTLDGASLDDAVLRLRADAEVKRVRPKQTVG